MLKDQQRIEEAYRATMLAGASASDFAVRSLNIEQRDQWVFRGLAMNSGVTLLERPTISEALKELDEVFAACAEPNWDGHDATPVHALTYERATTFLESLPSWVGKPDVTADPDGEIAFDWRFGRGRLLAVSIGLNGSLSFIYRNGAVRMRNTIWFLDQQVPAELLGFLKLLKR